MKRITPEADIVDITHAIEPLQVLQGSLVLANTLPYMPEGVHLAVVDPQVGTERKAVVVQTGDGRLLVGPDNGLLVPAAERTGGIVAAWEISDARFSLEPLSRTFHGRDVFAPAAAHLAAGIDPSELGTAIDPDALVRIDLPVARIGPDEIAAHVLIVDRFGNVQLNLTTGDVEGFGIWPGSEARARDRARALLRRRRRDVRRRRARRHRPLRGLLPEHRDCHQRGRRSVRGARAPG